MWYVTHVRDLRFKQRTSARTKRANTRNGFITGITTNTNDILRTVTLQQKLTTGSVNHSARKFTKEHSFFAQNRLLPDTQNFHRLHIEPSQP